jgi:hypothetical protein
MGRDEMRAADADRERVADALRQAMNEGRLDLHEYDERLQRTYAAKTYGDLDGLLHDLPTVVPAAHAQVVPFAGGAVRATTTPDGTVVHPDATRRWLVETWDDWAGAVGVTTMVWVVICLMSQEFQYFWPGWVAGPWGAYLVWETIRGLSTGEPQRWAGREERKRADKLAKKQAKRERRALEDDTTPSGDGRETAG